MWSFLRIYVCLLEEGEGIGRKKQGEEKERGGEVISQHDRFLL